MDLLREETNENKNVYTKKKKVVIILLILCVLALIASLGGIFILKNRAPVKDRLFLNGKEITLQEGLIETDQSGNKYISLELGAELLGYKYFNGEYGKNQEDRKKCYIQNLHEVVEFQLDKNVIYKINLDTNKQLQKFVLNNKVINNNEGKLYVTLEDFSKACNLVLRVSQDRKQVEFNTCDYLAISYTENIKADNKYTAIDEQYSNLKAIYYGMIVVSDGTNYGVIDNNKERVISARYSNIIFDEYTQNFIAQSNNKYGVLSKDKTIIDFKYDDIQILKYSPLLYQVKHNNKYGVLDETGTVIINTEYDMIGYNSNNQNESVLIIENVNNEEDGIVVCNNGKYGVVSIDTGKIVLNCDLEKIYAKTLNDDNVEYYVQIEGYEYELEEYIKYVNTTTVVTN